MILYETAQQNTEPYAVVTGESLPSAFLNVPARADGLPVRAIAPHAFAGASHLRTVSLPDSIVTIGNFAFHNCGALREISLYDSVTDYGDGVIRQCTSLSGIRLTMRAGYYTLLARMLS
ncbi:MAG: leucine-rich repeat protein, partial [Butyrivibrio sp.]|nr:leucine-rich repeat protein [Butyrivibrio sp.]